MRVHRIPGTDSAIVPANIARVVLVLEDGYTRETMTGPPIHSPTWAHVSVYPVMCSAPIVVWNPAVDQGGPVPPDVRDEGRRIYEEILAAIEGES